MWADLNAAGMVSGHAYTKGLRTVKTCVGTDFCRFGTQDSTGLGIRLEKRLWGSWTPHKVKLGGLGLPAQLRRGDLQGPRRRLHRRRLQHRRRRRRRPRPQGDRAADHAPEPKTRRSRSPSPSSSSTARTPNISTAPTSGSRRSASTGSRRRSSTTSTNRAALVARFDHSQTHLPARPLGRRAPRASGDARVHPARRPAASGPPNERAAHPPRSQVSGLEHRRESSRAKPKPSAKPCAHRARATAASRRPGDAPPTERP